MSISVSTQTELERFRDYLNQALLTNPKDTRSLEEIVDDWRLENPTSEEYEDSVRALRIAMDSLTTDPGMSLEEFDRSFREKHPSLKHK